ncbi:receptor-like protein kinase 2 [Euphorbia peplus]|nr:receptor-like protein kinase 2 [Euphorbia peplus]
MGSSSSDRSPELLLSLFFVLCFVSPLSAIDSSQEKSVLLELKSHVADPHGILSTWTSTTSDHCSWYGVTCNSDSMVISINLPGGGYKGNSPPPCSDSLMLNASGKKLKGELSPLIGRLSGLRFLSMPFNGLTGGIPLEIWGLENLEVLDFRGNDFTGRLPCGFSGLRKLRVFNLGFNRIRGEIPVSLSKCGRLEILNLAGNELEGSIPEFVGGFFKLRELYLSGNKLNGSVPGGLGSKCRYLEHLDLSGNLLSGRIPTALGKCRRLKTLLLFSNKLSGEIPGEIGQLRRLEVLDVSRNLIGGRIPAELGNCASLSVLVLSNLFETWPNKINESMKASVTLPTVANHEGNHFQGSIPEEITTLPKLRILWAPRATFGGRLPSNWGECKRLEMVNLAQNGLVGQTYGFFEKCKKLFHLDLSSNRLSGELDHKLQVPCMTFFDVSQNLLTGSIPKFIYRSCPRVSANTNVPGIYGLPDWYTSFFTCRTRDAIHLPASVANLSVIHNFGRNNFTSPINWLPIAPERLGKRTDYAFLANGNRLSGSFPVSLFGKCGQLHGMIINVSRNQISGPIPLDVGSICRSLRVLDVSENEISGPIPESLGELKFLVALNLSENKLWGQIPAGLYQLNGGSPSGLGHFTSLEASELPSNSHSGDDLPDVVKMEEVAILPVENSDRAPPVSTARSLSSISVSLYNLSKPLNGNLINCSNAFGNSCYVFILSTSPVSANGSQDRPSNASSQTETKSSNLKSVEIASIASAVAIISVLLLLVILFCHTKKWSSSARSQVSEPKEVTVFSSTGVPLLYENIVEATGNFNASNCIGNGGFGATYKAEILPGILVAVKKLAIGRLQGVQQFRAEIKALGRVRHPNLVTLIGYHASETEMFLIYNYLPGGNLENFIKKRSPRASNWKVLHKIALDIASVLAYLHHECAPRVLHRDIKPSNILLDNELNAYLSDFGLSRLLGTSETHATTGVAGTFGYVAPEYAMTCRVSDKADVYSYGVVLLELISDKRALDPSFSAHENGFTIVSWAYMLLRNGQARDVFTTGLWDAGPKDDLVEMLHLAVACTAETLTARPTMKQVVQRLKAIQPP